ncbi:MAG: zinc ribbon domain-containing protein [Candidatus Dormibacteraeota bacterium]|nr:zinc ribbon domain-containing protein [Candidatus Dormibacteraeota bacterium]
MPIYEYRCEDCDRDFELLSSFQEREAPRSCPTCAGEHTRVLISSFASIGASGEGSAVPMAASGGGCCGGSCGCGH